MAKYDLIISNGKAVLPSGVQQCDIAVSREKIAAILPPSSAGAEQSKNLLDASGNLVIPGGVDPHVHMYWPLVWDEEGGERPRSKGTDHVGMSALHGGTTTLIDFVPLNDARSINEHIKIRDEDFTGKCPCDYAYHLLLRTKSPDTRLREIRDAVHDGYPTIKMFTTDILPMWKGISKTDLGYMWEVFKVISKNRGMAVIHGEEDELVMHMTAKLMSEGRTHFRHLSEVHSALSEDMSFRKVLRLAENVPGTAVYMMHISASTGVEAVREARAKGLPAYGETLSQYLGFTEDNYLDANGQIYHTFPSLKSQEHQDALWEGVVDNTIQTIATDDICCTLRQKTKGEQIVDITGGNTGVETRIPVMFTEIVVKRGMSLERFVDLTSTKAAKIMGLYPQKGVIAPGSDADIVILEPRQGRISVADLHNAEYSPWEGREYHVWPVATVLRGEVVFEDGVLKAPGIKGRKLLRKISDDVLAGGHI